MQLLPSSLSVVNENSMLLECAYKRMVEQCCSLCIYLFFHLQINNYSIQVNWVYLSVYQNRFWTRSYASLISWFGYTKLEVLDWHLHYFVLIFYYFPSFQMFSWVKFRTARLLLHTPWFTVGCYHLPFPSLGCMFQCSFYPTLCLSLLLI